jgi:CRP-like cAMP-binding protein
MTLLVLDQRSFNSLLDAMPALAQKLLMATAQRLREANAKAIT